MNSQGENNLYRFALSRHWRWFNERSLDSLMIEFPPAKSITIDEIRFVTDDHIVPSIVPTDRCIDNIGVYAVDAKAFP